MSIVGRRAQAPALRTLQDEEEANRTKLVSLLVQVRSETPISGDPPKIRERIASIKSLCSTYEESSNTLAKRYEKLGSTQQANEVKNERLKIIYLESKEVVKNLNRSLEDQGEDALSSIRTPSHVDSYTPTTRNQELVRHEAQGLQPNAASNVVDNLVASTNLERQNQDILVRTSLNDAGLQANDQHSFHGLTEANVNRNDDTNPRYDAVTEYLRRTEPNNIDPIPYMQPLQENFPDELDPVSRHHLKQDLLKGMDDKFSGDPKHYWPWNQQISRRMIEAKVGPMDSMYILRANTTGRPQQIIQDHIAAMSHNPYEAL